MCITTGVQAWADQGPEHCSSCNAETLIADFALNKSLDCMFSTYPSHPIFSLIFVLEKYTNYVYLHSMLDSSKNFWIDLFGHMCTSSMMYSDMDRKTDMSQKHGTH